MVKRSFNLGGFPVAASAVRPMKMERMPKTIQTKTMIFLELDFVYIKIIPARINDTLSVE